ncbi:MAG: M81 family metallopeptidase [Actinomycetota bacterium]|jgi:microcystin degradation protein MlrC|nr:M81 family metallopeptidase [Actinomycetota bacterium]
MRIAIGGIEHETNTYAVESFGTTPAADFTQRRGDRVFALRGTRSYVGGMLKAADAAGHEVVPCLFAWAGPSGTIEADGYAAMSAELLRDIEAALPVDAVVLDMHGAGVVEGIDDLEADLARRVREVIGPDITLVSTLDLHGNITAEMAEHLDLMLGVHEYPHVDMYERGVEAVEALPQLVPGSWQPVTHVEQLPLLLPTSTTDVAPASVVRDACLAAESHPDVIDCTFFHGFPYTDIPEVGASIVVTTNNDLDLARAVAGQVATKLWDLRDEFRAESLTPEIALRQAVTAADRPGRTGPVVVNETSDNPGAGTPGDGTHVLRAMLDIGITEQVERAVYGTVFDPAVAAQAHAAGTGATIAIQLGGKHDELHGDPISTEAYVKTLSDGSFVHSSPMLGGTRARWGPTARLQFGGEGGLDVIVTSYRSQVFDTEIFELCGIDVRRYDVVVLKSSQHFRAGFAHLASAIVTADSPGLSTLDVTVFDHSTADGLRWPINPDTTWSPTSA